MRREAAKREEEKIKERNRVIGLGGGVWGVGGIHYLARSGLCHHAPGLASLRAYSRSQTLQYTHKQTNTHTSLDV